jgi:hypothetical protein
MELASGVGRSTVGCGEAASVHCTMSEIRRFDGSSGLDGTRNNWSAYPRTWEIWFGPSPSCCNSRRAELARSEDSSQLVYPLSLENG